ncbi:hypothetical protein [Geitlerinema sp. P-1104]|uniref:hypothetical protein n=1 Tax=Geitlerinema sp. P-1104 TaxID=2546230 RepID=UPI0014770A8D|nr:hypothetical protein [Geitlerinema sp. P-1104]
MTDSPSNGDRASRDSSAASEPKVTVVDVDPVTLFVIVTALLVLPVFLAGFFFQ